MGTIKTTNIEPIADNGTVTLGSSGDTITVPSGVTLTNSGIMSGQNYPAFYAYANSDQNITINTDTHVTLGSELFDSDGAFASNTFTVPTGKGGKYVFLNKTRADNVTGSKFARTQLYINDGAKEATEQRPYTNTNGHEIIFTSLCMLDLNAGDTVKYYFRTSSSGVVLRGNADAQLSHTWFAGYRIGS